MKSQKLLYRNHLFIKETSKIMFQYFNKGLQFCFKYLFKTKTSDYVRIKLASDLYPSYCRLSTTQQPLNNKRPLVRNKLSLEIRNSSKTLKSSNLKIHHYLKTAANGFHDFCFYIAQFFLSRLCCSLLSLVFLLCFSQCA